MWFISGGIFFGWALGSNDAANVFGTAVASRILKYRTAVILAAIFILLGAIVEGQEGVKRIGELTTQTGRTAFITVLAAGITVTIMTSLKLPVSASQAFLGALIGMGLITDADAIHWSEVLGMLACWVGTPIGAALLALLLYPLLARLLLMLHLNLIGRAIFLKTALVISGCYGAYALGANNVANITGIYYKNLSSSLFWLTLIGGASIALGVLTYSKNVMLTVGSRLVQLSSFSALVAVIAMAATVHFYAQFGVPVSTSQAIVGAVLGIGLLKGVKTINQRTVVRILFGWLNTPLIAGLVCWIAGKIFL
ncbi:MAG: inorganic phosphate transporter [Actinobacteria bacterium]|nr:inorganic phosphate transporter [Actinomycetota bacterium]